MKRIVVMRSPSTVIVLGTWIAFLITGHAASGQMLMKRTINKQHASAAVRQGLIGASAAKVAASANGNSGTGDEESANAGATFTLPQLGDGPVVIPTPSFNYTNIASAGNWGFTAQVWGNALGVDSDRLKSAANLLVPDISMVGLKIEGVIPFSTVAAKVFKAGLDIDLNLLAKKVSFFDSSAKTVTNFNPFIFHPRVGVTGVVKNIIFISVYGNILSVLSHNDEFSHFFGTNGKSLFVYPELDIAAIVNLENTGKQQIKFEFDLLGNNGDLQTMYHSSDKVIPYAKIGLVTAL